MGTIYRLSVNTCKECLREPVFYLMLLTAVALIGLFPTFSMFVFRKQIKLVVDSSLATTLMFGLFTAVLCSSHTITREMRNGTVLLLMSKPVTRTAFIASKMIGIGISLAVFVLLCSCSCILALLTAKDQFWIDYTPMCTLYGTVLAAAIYGGFRNYVGRKSYSANAVIGMLILMPLGTIICYVVRLLKMKYFDPEEFMPVEQLFPALLLLLLAVLTMGAISSAMASKLNLVGNLVACLVVFLLGLVVQYFSWLGLGGSSWRFAFSTIIPNWQNFWMADALSNGVRIPYSYVGWNILYAMLTVVIWGAWAVIFFQNNELARDSR